MNLYVCIHLHIHTHVSQHRGLGPMRVYMDFCVGAFSIWLLKIQQPCVSQDKHFKHNLDRRNAPLHELTGKGCNVTSNLNYTHNPRIT